MSQLILDERFTQPALDERLRWIHPPEHWQLDHAKRVLALQPSAETDFWQRTHYGFAADNGHFLGLEVSGDFDLVTRVRFHPAHQYDQAGLMIRADAGCWVKTSVEHELDGPPQLGVVVTNHGFSDWSMQDLPLAEPEIRLRLCLRGGDVTAEYGAVGDTRWKRMRIARLQFANLPLWCGLYACSPKAAGFRAEFKFLRVERA